MVIIHGGIGREERLKVQEAFKFDPEVQVLLATDAAGVLKVIRCSSFGRVVQAPRAYRRPGWTGRPLGASSSKEMPRRWQATARPLG